MTYNTPEDQIRAIEACWSPDEAKFTADWWEDYVNYHHVGISVDEASVYIAIDRRISAYGDSFEDAFTELKRNLYQVLCWD